MLVVVHVKDLDFTKLFQNISGTDDLSGKIDQIIGLSVKLDQIIGLLQKK
jgi:hypothetical protein